ncbi:CHAT domain-containing tetratricopeptide repeat protein [Deinococcus humi]|uniref:Tetratricopeptide (TPR) repeat protein n=1 Tax=Deinococcus humi TaxID=662880 RepID=A0A7W8JYY8_9DEIO|nr:CHAT domain-containing tetratricopeptide repeat protein [Deinococcus humi]MBB5365764.1 tetratricopeptide (TPR) repeat protein [Deinococcus humi]
MSRIDKELQRISRLPVDRQVGAYRNLHTLSLKSETGNYPGHERILEALLRAEHALKGSNEPLTVFAVALELQGRHLRRGVVFAGFLNNLATVLAELRRFDEALEMRGETLATRRAALPHRDPLIADSLMNMALVLSDLRRFDEALLGHQEALAIKREGLPAGHPDIAISLNNLGTALYELRRFDEALEKHEEALMIQRAALPDGDPRIANILNNLGNALYELSRFDEALEKHEEALKIRRQSLLAGDRLTAASLNNLANVLQKLNRLDEALEKHEEALVIRRAALPAGHPLFALSFHNLGNVLTDLRRYDDAVQSYRHALKIWRGALPKHHPQTAQTLHRVARVLGELGQPEQGLPHATEALNILLYNEQFPQISKTLWGDAAEFDESVPDTLALLLELATHPEVPELPGDVITALLTYKGNADIEQGLTSILHANATGPFCVRLDELQALQAEMARLQYSADAQDLLRVQEVTRQLQQLEQQIHTDPEGARLAEELQLRMITPPAVQSALHDDEALLNLFVSGDAVYAQVLHQDGRHHLHRYAASDLEEQVAHLRLVLGDPGLLLHEAALLQPLQGLYAALITPIAGLLGLEGDLKQLVISGDGFLYGLPWDLLCAPDASGARPLLAQVSTRLVPTPRDLLRLHRLASVPGSDMNPAVLLGVQSFEEDVDSDQEAPENGAVNPPPELRSAPGRFATRSAVVMTGGTAELPRYGNLNGTAQEIGTLSSLLTARGRAVSSHLSPDASEQTLLNIGVAPWVLHFSTHSDVWDAEQTRPLYQRAERLDPRYDPAHPFSRAVVLLDGYTRRNFQGVLRAWELGSLNLRGTELVTFSSCNSGLGDMTAGRGVAGLSQAAFLAGAQRTITTLWPVLDATTPQWMGNVYTARLDGASWQDAVREEKLRMLAEEQPVSAWAPFVLNGLA